MPGRKRELGEILRKADLVSEEQLAEALRLHKLHGERLASVLVRQRVLTEKFAVTYLGRQLGAPSVDLSKTEVELVLLDLVPLEICQKHLVLPLRIEAGRLVLAMPDPSDQAVISEVEFRSGYRVVPMVALEASLKNALAEAGRAAAARQKTIVPNVQREGAEGELAPSAAAAAAAAPPTPVPVPVATRESREAVAYESLGGTAGPLKHPAPPLPGVEEMQTILAVDDSAVALALVETTLKRRGYKVVTARTGREALARVREMAPDLVILDGMLPEVHGFEICRQLKTSERFRHIPVILVSAVHTGWRIAADIKEKYKADDYLAKPFEPADLLRRVEGILSRNRPVPPDSEAAVRQHMKDGVVALKNGQVEEAIAALRKGLDVDQFNGMLHYYLAMTYEKKGAVFEAIDHYERAVQIDPQYYDAITSLANLYQRQEFWRKAREMWELAIAATPDDAVKARIKEHLLSLL